MPTEKSSFQVGKSLRNGLCSSISHHNISITEGYSSDYHILKRFKQDINFKLPWKIQLNHIKSRGNPMSHGRLICGSRQMSTSRAANAAFIAMKPQWRPMSFTKPMQLASASPKRHGRNPPEKIVSLVWMGNQIMENPWENLREIEVWRCLRKKIIELDDGFCRS